MVSILEIAEENLTPGMKQYRDAKLENPDCVILLRMGDFYEMFYEDAEICSRDLEITLTKRGKGEKCAPLAGIPYHALEPYLGKLVSKGHKVAIIEQLEDPKKAKGLVKRGCVRIVTPGTLMESTLLDASENNYIIAVNRNAKGFFYSIADLSTGEMMLGNCEDNSTLFSEIERRSCSEIVLPMSMLVDIEFVQQLRDMGIFVSSCEDFFFSKKQSNKVILRCFGDKFASKFNLEIDDSTEDKNWIEYCLQTAGALIQYLEDNQKKELKHFKEITVQSNSKIMQLDRATLRNLELVTNSRGEKSKFTLFSVLDKTASSAGARMLKKVIKEPLLIFSEIKKRQDAVSELVNNNLLCNELQEVLSSVYDLKRLIGRATYGNASPKDLLALHASFAQLPLLKLKLQSVASSEMLKDILKIETFDLLKQELKAAIKEDTNNNIREGGVIAVGYNSELDSLLTITRDSKQILQKLVEREKKATGISTLKVSYNRVFGYFLEVSKKSAAKVPENYIRKQTTANSERYITEELKELENTILGAQEKIVALEYKLYHELMAKCAKETEEIQKVANKLATLDVICSLAKVAIENDYVKPVVISNSEEENILEIIDGRHPVVEKLEAEFIPNSVTMKGGEMMIITGPNTSGKSTVMRQTALIVLMAQIGSFVPASACSLSVVDRIFTRVGAHDDLAAGQSTFMVEMLETANILKHASSESLIILDEIGRGTSTFDGVAIAWSCAEYIYNKIRAKTMFATHYHILNKLADQFERIHNFNVAVREVKGEIVFLRRLVAGGCDQSHGIHVARMAGMPRDVVVRAQEIQRKLEKEDEMQKSVRAKRVREQLDLSKF
ncbi:DNA mismatch repair protein MutS [archaeon]|nr:DNA mismatch repair protein MutS [archaeon]MBT6762367.1 DNA mismatch repair protein MutS [archaeon]